MKKGISLLLVLVMCACMMGGCVFGSEEEATPTTAPTATAAPDVSGDDSTATVTPATGSGKSLPAMTTENITLTYMNFDSEVTTQKLAEKFMDLYPNITVKVIYVPVADHDTTMLNLMASGEQIDCFMYTSADFALSNDLLYDMTELWENDPENDNLLPTINEIKIGYFETPTKWGTPMKFFPGIIFVDRGVLETLNIDMPRADWTWEEMIQLIKDATDKTQEPAYYGLAVYNRLDSYYGIAASQKIIGEFGFNGKTFDLSVWAAGEQEFADLKINGYCAPNRETARMENWLGDWDAWAGSSGRVAVMSEAYWTYMNVWDTDAYKDLGVDFVPYAIPSVEEVDGVANSIATMDMGGISAGTEYPREAYELLKFMGWGVDGWNARLDLYYDQSITNASGDPLIRDSIPAPMTMDESVWERYKGLYPTDEEHKPYWDNYFANCIRPIPFGWMNIAGYWTFCDEYFNTIGIHDLVDDGTAKAADYADEATEMANEYHRQAMLDYFGIDITQ